MAAQRAAEAAPARAAAAGRAQALNARADYTLSRQPAPGDSCASLQALGAEIDAYFKGQLQDFDTQLDLVGTPFQRSVWRALRDIPHGQTRSYAQQAAQIGRPTATRAVAAANGCRRAAGAAPLSLAELREQGVLEYVAFPEALKGKYQAYTQADLGALRAAGYSAPMATVEEGVSRYIDWLQAHA